MKLSIVIPCYNEEKNLPLILSKFNEVIKDKNVEVILVNNGSKDNSANVLAELLPRYSFARTVYVEVNQGYGFGIISGLNAATGDFIGWTHADMQTDPADVLKAYKIVEENGFAKNLFIKGERKGRPLFDQVFTSGMSLFESLYLKKIIFDINAQPNIFHQSFYRSLKDAPHDFSLDLFFYYQAKVANLKIIRFVVKFPPRLFGTSSWNTSFKAKWKFIKRTVEFSRKLKSELNRV